MSAPWWVLCTAGGAQGGVGCFLHASNSGQNPAEPAPSPPRLHNKTNANAARPPGFHFLSSPGGRELCWSRDLSSHRPRPSGCWGHVILPCRADCRHASFATRTRAAAPGSAYSTPSQAWARLDSPPRRPFPRPSRASTSGLPYLRQRKSQTATGGFERYPLGILQAGTEWQARAEGGRRTA